MAPIDAVIRVTPRARAVSRYLSLFAPEISGVFAMAFLLFDQRKFKFMLLVAVNVAELPTFRVTDCGEMLIQPLLVFSTNASTSAAKKPLAYSTGSHRVTPISLKIAKNSSPTSSKLSMRSIFPVFHHSSPILPSAIDMTSCVGCPVNNSKGTSPE